MKTFSFFIGLITICNLLNGQVTEGLVGYFPFTDGSFTDESGYHDGVLSNAGDNTYLLVQDRFGNDNCAIDFQGAVINAGSNARDISSEVSISLWIKTTDAPDGHRYIITKYGYNFTDIPIAGYSMIFSDSVRFDSRDEDWRHNDYMISNYSESLVNDGEWHHLVGVTKNIASQDESILEIWVDGQKESSNNYGWNITKLNNPAQSLCIAGSEQYNTIPTFTGVLDDIRIFNRALDSMEIVQLLNEENPFVEPSVEISASESDVCADILLQFTAEIADADSIIWNFGDGSVSYEVSPEHDFSHGGTYEVWAKVINESSGLSSSDTIIGGIIVYPVYRDTVDLDVLEGELPYQFGSQSLEEGGTYTETFQSVQGCDSIVTLHLNVIVTGMENPPREKEEIHISPNPSRGIFMVHIQTPHPGPSEISVYNMAGVEVFRKESPAGQELQIDLSKHEEGLYLLRIKNGNKLYSRKLVLRMD